MQNEFEYLEKFQVYTNYFLSCETDCQNFSSENCNLVFIKIFNSILFESDEKIKSKKVAYLVFWLNFIIELRNRQIEEPLLTTILTIIDKLDLQQLIKYTSKLLPFDFSAEINYEVRYSARLFLPSPKCLQPIRKTFCLPEPKAWFPMRRHTSVVSLYPCRICRIYRSEVLYRILW